MNQLFVCILGGNMKLATWLAILVLLLSVAGSAQTNLGSIAGTVTDKTGAVVPNATVTATDTDKKIVVRTVKTNSSGDYSIPLLPVGHYTLTIDAAGFQKFNQTNIVLDAADKLTFNAQMQIGSGTEQVTVEANAAQVETQTPQAA